MSSNYSGDGGRSRENGDGSEGSITSDPCNVISRSNSRYSLSIPSINDRLSRRRSRSTGSNTSASAGDVAMQSNFSAKIAIHNPIVFDHGRLAGTLLVTAVEEGVMQKVAVSLVCSLVVKRTDMINLQRVWSLYESEQVVRRDNMFKKGLTSIEFVFALPSGMPCSFGNGTCSVDWEVRFIDRTNPIRPSTTRCRILKASIYRSLPGFIPTAQAERKLFMNSSKRIRIEAQLSSDVFTAGTPIGVCIKIHNDYKLLHVKRVKTKVVQTCEAWVEGRRLFAREVDLDFSKHDAKQWEKLKVEGLSATDMESPTTNKNHSFRSGVVTNKEFALLPRIDKRGRCAVQKTIIGKSADGKAITKTCLAPTTGYTLQETGMWVFIKYLVVIKCEVYGAEDINFTLNATLQNQMIENDADGAIDMESCLVFSPMDSPPEYNGLNINSKTSYTSLRRNSTDSVFARVPSLQFSNVFESNLRSNGTLDIPSFRVVTPTGSDCPTTSSDTPTRGVHMLSFVSDRTARKRSNSGVERTRTAQMSELLSGPHATNFPRRASIGNVFCAVSENEMGQSQPACTKEMCDAGNRR
eukprot:CFRG7548T1